MIDLSNKSICTGCSACGSKCPQNCIVMIEDEEGFLYPQIDKDKCTNCGLCVRVCEATIEKLENSVQPEAYGAYAHDTDMRFRSSSGGIFSLFANQVIGLGGVVFGARMDEDCKSAIHVMISDKSGIDMLRGSKYLQSKIRDTYNNVREQLDSGKKVLFTGTPCQIDGLNAYLGKAFHNLLCMDFVCHGVPSPLLWKKYCDYLEEKAGGKITDVNFRHKKYSWEQFGLQSTDANNKVFYKSKDEDPYLRMFLKNYSLRPSCYECGHKGPSRYSDITVADFWGVKNVINNLSDGKGVSLVLIHSSKGAESLDNIRVDAEIQKVDYNRAISGNMAAIRSAKYPIQRDSFFDDLHEMDFEALAKKYVPISTKELIKFMLKKSRLYPAVKKLRGGGSKRGIWPKNYN